MEEILSLKEILARLKKRMGLIITITIIAGLACGIVNTFFITPIYQASTQILLSQAKNEQNFYISNEVITNLQLMNTYSELIKSPVILEKVAEELKGKGTASQLNKKITVTSETNSQLLNLSVEDPDPQTAADIANKTAEVFQKQIPQIMNINNVKILLKADPGKDPKPIKPNKALNMAIAYAAGLLAGVGLALLLESLNHNIKDEQDVKKELDLPVLGVIAKVDGKQLGVLREVRQTAGRGEVIDF